VYDAQVAALDTIGADAATRATIFGGTFDRIFAV
jgi:hypothetical protein